MKFNVQSFLKKKESYHDNKLPFKINLKRIEQYSFDQLVSYVGKYHQYTESLREQNEALRYDVDEILDAYHEVLEIHDDLHDININLNNRVQKNELKIQFKEFLPHTLQQVLQDCGFINNEFQSSYEKMTKQFDKCSISLQLTQERIEQVPHQHNEDSLETTNTKSGQNLKIKQFEKVFGNALESFQNIQKGIQQVFDQIKQYQDDCLGNLSQLLINFVEKYKDSETETNFKNLAIIQQQQLNEIIQKSSELEYDVNKKTSYIQKLEDKVQKLEKRIHRIQSDNQNFKDDHKNLQEKYQKLQTLKNFCEEKESQNYDQNQTLREENKMLKNQLLNLRSQMLIKDNQMYEEKKQKKKQSFVQPKSARFVGNDLFKSTNFKLSQRQSNLSRLQEDICISNKKIHKKDQILNSLLVPPEDNLIADITENSQESLLINQPSQKSVPKQNNAPCQNCQQQKEKIEFLQKEQLDLIEKLKISNEKFEKQKFANELFNQEESLLFNDKFEDSKSEIEAHKQQNKQVQRQRLSTEPILITVTKTSKKQRNCLQRVEQGLKQIYKNYVLIISNPDKLQSQGIYLLEKQLNDLQELINLFLN